MRTRLLFVRMAAMRHHIDRVEPTLEEALIEARRLGEQSGGPVLLLDHADNCASGATQDSMHVLKAALGFGLTGIAVGPVRDPEAVARMVEAGIGNRVTLPVGGKADMPAIGRKGEPMELTGIVRNITGGEYTITDATNHTARITAKDLYHRNGVVQVIDQVLMPNTPP